jgi:hypothetical protein
MEAGDALLPAINNGLIFMLGIVMSLLLGIVIWLAKKVDQRLDEINKSLKETNRTLVSIDRDLRSELGHLDRRVTRVEARFDGGRVS